MKNKSILLLLAGIAIYLCGCVSMKKHNQELRDYFISGVIVGREQGRAEACK